MRTRAIVRMASILTAAVLIAVPIHGAAASKPARYSQAWLAQHHTQYDTTLTALYEAQVGYGGATAGTSVGRSPSNIRMSNTGFAGNQNEFQIDINPTNHLFAIGASNDGRPGGTGAYRTSDGGKTWIATDMFPALASCCDPGVAYAFDGTAYFESLDLSPAVVHVFSSIDNGATWTQKTDIAVEDRPNIVVDNGASSPHKGRVFVTWSDFGTTNEIRLYYSDNGGSTWSGPINVSHTNVGGAAYPQASQPRVASDGTVYVGFQFYPDGTNNSAIDKVAKSIDGGATFATATTITSGPNVQGGLDLSGDARGYFAVNSSCTTFRHRSFPIMGVDPTNSSIVYAAWAGGNLETAYTCGTLTGVHSDILFSRSINGGTTWSAPLKVNDDPAGHDQYYPWMGVAPNGRIWIGWHDRRDDASNFLHVYYTDVSLDGGLTFGVDKRVGNFKSLPSSFIGDYDGLAAENDMVLPMWWDSRNSATGDPYTARIKG